MKSALVKRSIVIAGHKTSVSLEDAFWRALKEIAAARHMTLSELAATIDSDRVHGNLSSAMRLFVLDYFQTRTSGKTPDAREDDPNRNGERREFIPQG
ncbi:MAG: ribbon-helix-helix domain-containing protein [Xanthobacteraceae bacterium]